MVVQSNVLHEKYQFLSQLLRIYWEIFNNFILHYNIVICNFIYKLWRPPSISECINIFFEAINATVYVTKRYKKLFNDCNFTPRFALPKVARCCQIFIMKYLYSIFKYLFYFAFFDLN